MTPLSCDRRSNYSNSKFDQKKSKQARENTRDTIFGCVTMITRIHFDTTPSSDLLISFRLCIKGLLTLSLTTLLVE